MFVERFTTYPVTGAQGCDEQLATIGPSGILGDRTYVLYDPETHQRVSSKPGQAPGLMRVRPHRGNLRPVLHFYDESGEQIVSRVSMEDYLVDGISFGGDEVTVDEFGEATPCTDTGDNLAEIF